MEMGYIRVDKSLQNFQSYLYPVWNLSGKMPIHQAECISAELNNA